MLHVSFSGGKDSVVLLDLIKKIVPAKQIEIDVSPEHFWPETMEILKQHNCVFHQAKKNFSEVIGEYGFFYGSKLLREIS